MSESRIVEETLAITRDQLLEFFADKDVDVACSCGRGHFSLSWEQGDKPSLLAMPDPRDRSSSNWFFWSSCNHCAAVRLYAAGIIWSFLFADDKSDKNV